METINQVEALRTLLLFVALTLWLHWLWKRRNLYRFSFKFPGKFGLPLLGILHKVANIKDLEQLFNRFYKSLKCYTFCIWMGWYPVVVTAEPDFIKNVLLSSELLNKANTLYSPLYKLLKGGLVASPVSEWQHNRKMINPCFSHNVLVSFLPIFNKAKNSAIKKLESKANQGEHELYDILQRISLGISFESTMGKVMQDNDHIDDDFGKKVLFAVKTLTLQVKLSVLKLDGLLTFYSKYNQTKDYMYRLCGELIQEKIKTTTDISRSKEEFPSEEKDVNSENSLKKTPLIFIDQAIKIYQKQKFSWNDVICESNAIVAASYETTANSVFCTLVMLAMHPEVQERIYEEILSVFPEKSFEMEYEHMKQLPYLDMVINETLRLAPPIPVIGRQVVKDTQLSKDIILPKGLQILISIFDLHRRKDIWGQKANEFDPDHFLPENLRDKHAYAYLPFSKGIRNCIGSRYALMALKVMLVGMLRNYRFTTDFRYENLQFAPLLVLRYTVEPKLKIYHREQ